MTDNERRIITNITKFVSQMNDRQKEKFLIFTEGLACRKTILGNDPNEKKASWASFLPAQRRLRKNKKKGDFLWWILKR